MFTKENAKEMGRRGADATKTSFQKRKNLKMAAREILNAPPSSDIREQLGKMGLAPEEIEQMTVFGALFHSCVAKIMKYGSAKDLETLCRIAGVSSEHENIELKKQEIKKITQAATSVSGGIIEIPAIIETENENDS